MRKPEVFTCESSARGERAGETRGELAPRLGAERAEHAAHRLGQMRDGIALGVEDEMVEHALPDRAARRRQVVQREDGVEQSVDRGQRLAHVVPPVIDKHAERIERADGVPPEIRDIERVAGVELGDALYIPYFW